MKRTTTFLGIIVLILTFSLTSISLLHAQNRDGTEISVKDLPRISVTSAMGNFNANFSGLHVSSAFLGEHLGEWLGTGSDHSFKLSKENTDQLGIKHCVYQHYYKGVKVMDDVVMLHERKGELTYVNGEIISKIPVLANQQLSSAQIKSIITSDLHTSEKVRLSGTEEVIAKVVKGKSTELYYTSKVEALLLTPLQNFIYYIDNSSGAIVKKISKLHHSDTPSVSSTYYKGDQSITVDSYNGAYRLKDNARNIHTMDGTNQDIDTIRGGIINVTEYVNPVANYTATETKPPVEAHWAMKNTYDYYVNRHNRNSYDGNGSKIDNYYNYNFGTYTGGLNAAALDTPLYGGIVCMLYGNGALFGFSLANPLVGLDIAGHEYSHLVIGRNGLGGLNYQGESGAINESIADMMGTAIEFYSGANPNWTIGEGITKSSIFDPSPTPYIRSMSAPNSAQSLLGSPQPDTYNGTYWKDPAVLTDDYGGVHNNSGVGNYWFYLLSAGGSGTNDIGNTFNVTGITIQKAEKIIYHTLTAYTTPNMTYLDLYNATQQAVTDLYGASGTEQQQNINAWYAIGIGSGTLSTVETAGRLERNLSIYPNPVKNNVFTIENDQGNAAFEIYDISGKLIRKNEKLNKGTNKINIIGVQKGIYLVKINTEGNTVSKKIIVE